MFLLGTWFNLAKFMTVEGVKVSGASIAVKCASFLSERTFAGIAEACIFPHVAGAAVDPTIVWRRSAIHTGSGKTADVPDFDRPPWQRKSPALRL